MPIQHMTYSPRVRIEANRTFMGRIKIAQDKTSDMSVVMNYDDTPPPPSRPPQNESFKDLFCQILIETPYSSNEMPLLRKGALVFTRTKVVVAGRQ